MLVYEGGEGLRFDEFAIKAGVDGIANVMLKTGMLQLPDGIEPAPADRERQPVFANTAKWIRAPDGGVFRPLKRIGHAVSEGETVGFVANPYEDMQTEVKSLHRGIIVGSTPLPIVNMGDALYHIAWSEEHDRGRVAKEREISSRPAEAEVLMDEDEII